MTVSTNPTTGLPTTLVVLDTETTGFRPEEGHRMVEIGAVRMRDGLPTGESFHAYINPERDVPQGAVDVHGLTQVFLSDKPLFADVAGDFLAFLGDDAFAAHNASFDLKFLNAELARLGKDPLPEAKSHDTVAVARRLFPGAQASLDALCRRFKISLTGRTKHGALVDAELLADVIVEMGGGRQQSLFGTTETSKADAFDAAAALQGPRPERFTLPEDEIAAHKAFVLKELGADSIWAGWYANAETSETPTEEAA